jgi:hypothetical protein
MADLLLNGEAALRAAEALLRANGGRDVLLRLPAPAANGNDAEQLGLATPLFQDAPLGPAAFRKAGETTSLLVAGYAVQALLGSLKFDSADVLFETAAGVVVDGVLYAITASEPAQFAGVTCCYRLTLREPAR